MKIIIALGLILSLNTAKASQMDSIFELDRTSKHYNEMALELSEKTAELQNLVGCQSVNFDSKYKKVFAQRRISYHINKNILGENLKVAKCSQNVIERLMGLINTFQVESAAWAEMYQAALKAKATTSVVAKKELTRIQEKQKEALEELKSETKKAKPDYGRLKSILFGALIGISALIALTGVGLFIIGSLTLLFAGASLTGSIAGPAIFVMCLLAGGTGGVVLGNNLKDDLQHRQDAYEKFLGDVELRTQSLERSQKFIDAMKDDGGNEESIINYNLY